MQVAALIVAAGRGDRAGPGLPKQYRPIGGETILARALQPFLEHDRVSAIRVVIAAEDENAYGAATTAHAKLGEPVIGGATRQDSVRLGLQALAGPDAPDQVLIHDAARPFVDDATITAVLAALSETVGAIPALPIADTVKVADPDMTVSATVPRDGLWLAQTPQAFRFADIMDAHERAAVAGAVFTDDAGIAEWAGLAVSIVPGSSANRKLTSAADIADADTTLRARDAVLMETRVGGGFDVHAFGPGSGIVLGGIAIAHDRRLVGHSDADVALHALTDAILGALADGDIGAHFPPDEPEWQGAGSDRFLADAVARVGEAGGRIAHLDLTIIAEVPRIAPHREAMRQRIAEICRIDVRRVSVKATTTEGLGFTGRQEGIAASATATLQLPPETDA